MLLSKCAVCGSKKSKFIKDQEASGLLSSLGIKKRLSEIPLVLEVLVNKILLAADKFMSEMDLRQPGFTYSACGPFTKTKRKYKKLKNLSYAI